jgi:hypothetical protein
MRRRFATTPGFVDCLATLGDAQEALDVLFALALFAARTPDKGGYIEAQDVWIVYSRPHRGHPALRLYYRFDEEEVVLEWVEGWEG